MGKVKLIYVGKRWFDYKCKLVYAFLHEGKEVHFGHIKASLIIGYAYEAEQDGDNLSIYANPPCLSRDRDIDDLEIYEIKDIVAAQERQKYLMEKRMKEKADLLKDIHKFDKFFKGLTYHEARVFSKYIVDKVFAKRSKNGDKEV